MKHKTFIMHALKLDRATGWLIAAALLALMAWLSAITVGWVVTAAFGAATVISASTGIAFLASSSARRWFLASMALVSVAVVAAITIGWFAPALGFAAAGICFVVGIRRSVTSNRLGLHAQ
jgi:hypothetical protein